MNNMQTLPILLKNTTILLIGGGKVAFQKAKVLHDNNITFFIVAKKIDKKLYSIYANNIVVDKFKKKYLTNMEIVIDATGNNKVFKKLQRYKKKHNILINVVDKPEKSDFYFMALTKNAQIQISVTSHGASPTLAAHIRDRAVGLIPPQMQNLAQNLKFQRSQGKIDVQKTKKRVRDIEAKVQLIGCGLGDPELLTLKAYSAIYDADVILYDHLISAEILGLIPDSTAMYYVGKQKGAHSISQDNINKLMESLYREGKKVARLKSGDPFVYGRGAEEIEYLNAMNISVEIIPGISSAIAAPLLAGIPITARGYSNGFTVVSAHLRGNRLNLDWVSMLKNRSHTLVVLMGLSRVAEIVNMAQELEVDMLTPCAIVSNASRKNQKTVFTTMCELKKVSLDISGPAVIIFGSVVDFKKTRGNLTC